MRRGARYGHMSVVGKSPDIVCSCAAIRRAARRVTRFYDQALAASGLRVTQYSILATLGASGPVTMGALADQIGMDRATMGHNLRPLEARGLLTLAPGTDKRSRLVALTDAGRQLVTEARPAWRAAQKGFEAAFGAEDLTTLHAVLGKAARLTARPADLTR